MTIRQYTESERDFVTKWADSWQVFFDLIFKLLRSDVLSVPTEIDEISYQSLCGWFTDNRASFSVLWKDFCESQDWSLDTSNDLIEEIRDAEQTLGGPLFFGFFDFEDLDTLLRACLINDRGKRSEQKAREAITGLFLLDTMAINFVSWIYTSGEMVGGSEP